LLLTADLVKRELEVDEREEDGEEPVETHVHGLATGVVIQQFFAQFKDRDDPEEPGEEKSVADNEGREGPVERTGAVIDLAHPDTEIGRPRDSDHVTCEVPVGRRKEPENERFSGSQQQKNDSPMNARRRRKGAAVIHSIMGGRLLHTTSYPEMTMAKRSQPVPQNFGVLLDFDLLGLR
jgi:hypothetical protein